MHQVWVASGWDHAHVSCIFDQLLRWIDLVGEVLEVEERKTGTPLLLDVAATDSSNQAMTKCF